MHAPPTICGLLQANFLTPLAMMPKDDEFKEKIAAKVRDSLNTEDKICRAPTLRFDVSNVNDLMAERFKPLLQFTDATVPQGADRGRNQSCRVVIASSAPTLLRDRKR